MREIGDRKSIICVVRPFDGIIAAFLCSTLLVCAHTERSFVTQYPPIDMFRLPAGITRFASVRGFSSSLATFNVPKSSCAPGTVLNLKVRKNGDEPVALDDHEYPEWLWDILDKSKIEAELKEKDPMKWRKKQNAKRNTSKIKNNNFLSQM